MAIVEATHAVTGGVDTHLDVNVAAVLDDIGGLLGVEEFATDAAGHRRLVSWLCSFGTVVRVGVEGTGSYGVGLARTLRAADIDVVEVDRPNRSTRRRQGKSDPLDAVEAARAALSGRARGAAKTRDGDVEAIRALMGPKRSWRSTKTKTLNQLRHLGFCAPRPTAATLLRPVGPPPGRGSGRLAAPIGRRSGGVRHEDGHAHPRPAGGRAGRGEGRAR